MTWLLPHISNLQRCSLNLAFFNTSFSLFSKNLFFQFLSKTPFCFLCGSHPLLLHSPFSLSALHCRFLSLLSHKYGAFSFCCFHPSLLHHPICIFFLPTHIPHLLVLAFAAKHHENLKQTTISNFWSLQETTYNYTTLYSCVLCHQ